MRALVTAALLLALIPPAAAQTPFELHLSPTGTDSGNCQSSPCLTPQYAVDQIPQGSFATITFAPGAYHGSINIYEFRRIGITGNCGNPAAVVLYADPIPGQPVVWAQDHPTLSINCMMLVATAADQVFLSARQHAILDFGSLYFEVSGNATPNAGISINDLSTATCMGTMYVYAPLAVYAAASDSKLYVNCAHMIGSRVGYLLYSVDGGVIDATAADFHSAPPTGAGYIADSGIVKLGGTAVVGQFEIPPG